eukprot:3321734-Karenia_brevis.AAC.1
MHVRSSNAGGQFVDGSAVEAYVRSLQSAGVDWDVILVFEAKFHTEFTKYNLPWKSCWFRPDGGGG